MVQMTVYRVYGAKTCGMNSAEKGNECSVDMYSV